MTEYIFYTTEGYTQAPDGEDIENCQLLGRAYGIDKHDALQNLLTLARLFGKELISTTNAEEKLSFITSLLDKRQLEEYEKWLKTIE